MAAPHWLAQMALCLDFKDAHRGKTHKASIIKYLKSHTRENYYYRFSYVTMFKVCIALPLFTE